MSPGPLAAQVSGEEKGFRRLPHLQAGLGGLPSLPRSLQGQTGRRSGRRKGSGSDLIIRQEALPSSLWGLHYGALGRSAGRLAACQPPKPPLLLSTPCHPQWPKGPPTHPACTCILLCPEALRAPTEQGQGSGLYVITSPCPIILSGLCHPVRLALLCPPLSQQVLWPRATQQGWFPAAPSGTTPKGCRAGWAPAGDAWLGSAISYSWAPGRL